MLDQLSNSDIVITNSVPYLDNENLNDKDGEGSISLNESGLNQYKLNALKIETFAKTPFFLKSPRSMGS